MKSLTLLFVAATSSFSNEVDAFLPSHHCQTNVFCKQRKFSQRRYSSITNKDLSSPLTNPKTVTPATFGKPISTEVNDFNRAMIGFIKKAIFDTFYPSDGVVVPPSSSSSTATATASVSNPYARFYALETIARMPYFAYLSVLHLYETLGLFRKARYMELHFAESWNELHHLLIMEELGGNDRFQDRFVAQHIAFAYYWLVVAVYLFNPILAYNLNQMVEEEAFHTYDEFVRTNREVLQTLEAPQVAKEYYGGSRGSNHNDEVNDDSSSSFYLLERMSVQDFECEQDQGAGRIRVDSTTRKFPMEGMETLLDVFMAIRDDEAEHAKAMSYLQRPETDIDVVKEDGEVCEVDN